MIVHANKYDGIEVWCGHEDPYQDGHDISSSFGGSPVEDLVDVTCGKCLDAIIACAGLAMARRNADIEGDSVKAFVAAYQAHVPGWSLNATGEKSARDLIKRFGLQRSLDALDAAATKVIRLNKKGEATEESTKKLFGATFIMAEPPDVQALYKIRARIRKRWHNTNDARCIGTLRRALSFGAPIGDIEARCDDLLVTDGVGFFGWCAEMDGWIQELRAGA
jgi:hypothetical protein